MNREQWLKNIESIFGPAEFAAAIISAEFRIIYANPALQRTFGALEGKTCAEYFNQRKTACPWCNLPEVSAGSSQRWEWGCEKSGRIFQIMDSLISDENGRPCKLSVFHDITAIKRVEQELAASLNRYRDSCELLEQTFSSLQEAVVVVDLTDGVRRILNCNAGCEKMFGYTREELIGKTTESLHVDRAMYESFRDGAVQAFQAGKPFDTRFWMRRKNGDVFPTEHFVQPMFDASGKVQKNVSVIRDITKWERAAEDQRRMQDQVHQASKLASIGTLAAGVAHEIRSPLMVIRGNLDVLADLLDRLGVQDPSLNRFISAQETAINRISEILKSLLAHVRRDSGEVARFDVHEAVTDTVALVDFIYKKQNIRITCDLAATNSKLESTPSRIQQVIMNLVVNAKDAIEQRGGSGRIAISTRNAENSRGAEELVLAVQDDGCGIPQENIEKIFGFFFTTKGPETGTGLGLSITDSIVKGLGGTIRVASEVGKGTTFSVHLPLAAEKDLHGAT